MNEDGPLHRSTLLVGNRLPGRWETRPGGVVRSPVSDNFHPLAATRGVTEHDPYCAVSPADRAHIPSADASPPRLTFDIEPLELIWASIWTDTYVWYPLHTRIVSIGKHTVRLWHIIKYRIWYSPKMKFTGEYVDRECLVKYIRWTCSFVTLNYVTFVSQIIILLRITSCGSLIDDRNGAI